MVNTGEVYHEVMVGRDMWVVRAKPEVFKNDFFESVRAWFSASDFAWEYKPALEVEVEPGGMRMP